MVLVELVPVLVLVTVEVPLVSVLLVPLAVLRVVLEVAVSVADVVLVWVMLTCVVEEVALVKVTSGMTGTMSKVLMMRRDASSMSAESSAHPHLLVPLN